ncbi:hypothetical protein BVC80_1157g1 [Macleaya cordata]|uniref:Uncharacterized protein n=1 Tax=Macleaya cordata TaxID=56857 RepID=A0A200QR66_MACCD|nr:hypothetical protein BVC80_1157g1 [Macleaya cordata]
MVDQVGGHFDYGWSALPSRGRSGGILMMWNKQTIEVVDICYGNHSISWQCITKCDGFKWVISGVYGPNDDGERTNLWDELNNLCNS